MGVCDEINKIFGHAAGPILSRIVNDAIDKAQHELSPRKRLPCPLRKKCYRMTLIGLPIVAFFCYQAYAGIQLLLAHPQTTTPAPSESAEESVDLLVVPGVSTLVSLFHVAWRYVVTMYKSNKKTMKPLLRNAIFAYLATVPMMCRIVNAVISGIEMALNKVLLSLVKGKIPGGVPKLQVDVDRA